MKTPIGYLILLASLSVIKAQTPATGAGTGASQAIPYTEVYRDANSSIWERTLYEQGPNGESVPKIHRYTEIASGLHYWQNGQWLPSKELIEAFSGGAAARQGQHKVIFANNLNTAGSIDLEGPDGKRIQSTILGLAYVDTASGNSVQIAQLQDSEGELISDNQVLYANAFDGIKADVRYTYTRASFEQDVILQEQPPSPESFGFNPQSTELEVITEVINAPKAVTREIGQIASGLEADENVSWGAMSLGQSKAFEMGDDWQSARVSKRLVTEQGRTFLLETVRFQDVTPYISTLPVQASVSSRIPSLVSKSPLLPKRPLAQTVAKPMKLAGALQPTRGYVLDYTTFNDYTYYTNFTFQADSTYFIGGHCYFYGMTTVEGGTVLKYTNGTYFAKTFGPVNCLTGPYRPAIITSKDDNTVGQTISGSTGTPSGLYGYCGLYCTTNVDLEYLHVSYTSLGLLFSGGTANVLRHSQFLDGSIAVEAGAPLDVGNILIQNMNSSAFSISSGVNVTAENVTIHHVGQVAYSSGLTITNSLFVVVTNWTVGFNGAFNATNNSDAGVFQIVGAGSHYLNTNSVYRNVGTTNVPPILLKALQAKTTYPPIVYSNVNITVPTTLVPQAQRDTDVPDLGYHYEPLDYAFGGIVLSNSLTLTNGVAIGMFDSSGNWGGLTRTAFVLALRDGAVLNISGGAINPIWMTRYCTVQEGGNGNWGVQGPLASLLLNGSGTSINPVLNGTFTKFSTLANMNGSFQDNGSYGSSTFQNCEFYLGNIASYRSPIYFTNCLLFRNYNALWAQQDAANFTMINCTYYNGFLAMCRYAGQSASFWNIQNVIFDGTALLTADNLNGASGSTLFNYDAYNTNNLSWQTYNSGYSNTNTLEVVGAQSRFMTNVNWQTGYLGSFYQPSNSPTINTGSATAAQLGLYHFTVMTNLVNGWRVKETNSVVDIGYHYVATDTNGIPIDSNGDGIPDYIEDANGNGLVDTGEWAWNIPGDIGLQVFINKPRNGSSLP